MSGKKSFPEMPRILLLTSLRPEPHGHPKLGEKLGNVTYSRTCGYPEDHMEVLRVQGRRNRYWRSNLQHLPHLPFTFFFKLVEVLEGGTQEDFQNFGKYKGQNS